MAAPFPPQGEQQQHTERPLKVYGEQYLAGQPLPVGALLFPGDAPDRTEVPRVFTPAGWVVLHETDWVISNRYTGTPMDVISAEEFTERFGPGGGP